MKDLNKFSSKRIRQSCRYYYQFIKRTTIKETLIKNDWIFNDTWNFWTYCPSEYYISMPEAEADPIVGDKYILFSGMIHNFQDWQHLIDWDDYGTWYSYKFPIQPLRTKEVILLGIEWEIPFETITNSPLTNYYSLSEEWQFIHNIQPDIFISKKGSGVIVGSTDLYTLSIIENNLKLK